LFELSLNNSKIFSHKISQIEKQPLQLLKLSTFVWEWLDLEAVKWPGKVFESFSSQQRRKSTQNFTFASW